VRVFEALRILEAAVIDCRTRDIDTSEVRKALDVIEPYCWPEWRIDGFRDQLISHEKNGSGKSPAANTRGIFSRHLQLRQKHACA
jgi:hypothetical protein